MSSVCYSDALDTPRPSSLYVKKMHMLSNIFFYFREEINTSKLARFSTMVPPHNDVKKMPWLTLTVEKKMFCVKDDMLFIVAYHPSKN